MPFKKGPRVRIGVRSAAPGPARAASMDYKFGLNLGDRGRDQKLENIVRFSGPSTQKAVHFGVGRTRQ